MPVATRLALGALGLGWLLLMAGLAVDSRRDGPEATIRRYLADLGAERIDQALAGVDPAATFRWRDFVDFQQHNRYEVLALQLARSRCSRAWSVGVPGERPRPR